MDLHLGILLFDAVLLIATGVCLTAIYNELQEEHGDDE